MMQQFLILYFRILSLYLMHFLFSSLDVSAAGSPIPWLLYFQLGVTCSFSLFLVVPWHTLVHMLPCFLLGGLQLAVVNLSHLSMLEVGFTCLLLWLVRDMLMTLDRKVCPNTKLDLSSPTLETHNSLRSSTHYLDHLEIFNKL